VAEAATQNETLKTAAQVNTLDNFEYVFVKMLDGLFIERMEGNEEITDRVMNNPAFHNLAAKHLAREVYGRLRGPGTER
jgi:type I restriction enzyme R subunit